MQLARRMFRAVFPAAVFHVEHRAVEHLLEAQEHG